MIESLTFWAVFKIALAIGLALAMIPLIPYIAIGAVALTVYLLSMIYEKNRRK